MSEKEIGFGASIEGLAPFAEWLKTLTPAEHERVLGDVRDLNELGVPDAEALVRADHHSAFAEVTRAKSIGCARRSALMMWELRDDGEDLISKALAGASVWRCGDMMRAVRMMRDGGLSKERIAEIGTLIARFALYTAIYHLDTASIHGHQGEIQFLLMEYRANRPTGRQATSGKWDEHSGRPMHGPGNPFPGPADGPSRGGPAGNGPK